MTICKHCSVEFEPATTYRQGFACKTCKNGLDRYGLDRKQQLALLESQDNKCALCEKPIELHMGNNFNACVDHDHNTKQVRGILCGHCNTALGKLEGINIENFIKNLKKYLHL